MTDRITHLVERIYWFAHGLGVNEATLRDVIATVLEERTDEDLVAQMAEIRRRLIRAVGA